MERRRLISVGALAAAALLLESSLTRFLGVAQFYHFAFLVVSLALLGFGASGSILFLLPRSFNPETDQPDRLDRILGYSGLAFALSVGLAYTVVNLVPFDSYSIAWDRRQLFYFGLYYLVLTIPFVCAGLGIGAALADSQGRSHLVYTANLLGSAGGVMLAPFLLWMAGVPGAVLMSGLVGLLVALGGFPAWGRSMVWGFRLAFLVGLAGFGLLTWLNLDDVAPLGMAISPYKGLSYARRIPGSTTLLSRWNAISRLDLVAGASTRVMPGLSYAYPGDPPPQIGLAIDADSLQPITLAKPEEFPAASYLPESIAFTLRPDANVLVLEPGGGLGVLQALAGGAKAVSLAEDDPLIPELISKAAPETNVYAHSKVRVALEPPRVFLQRDSVEYDVVFLPLTDPYRPVASGAFSLSETYSLTVEAFNDMLAHLSPDGLLVASRWLQTPPSEEIRLVGTLVEALQRRGVPRPVEKLVAFRGIQTLTILVQPDGWSTIELATVRQFCDSRRYDLVWAPDILPEETNRYNRLPESIYHQTLQALFRELKRGDFYRSYPFAIVPPTDDQPFFFHFFKWGQTPQLLAMLGHVWQPFGGSGYFVLLALLALVLVFSVLLIGMPLVLRRSKVTQSNANRPPDAGVRKKWRVLFYFGGIGLAYLFIEIPLIQRSILLLGHPIYAFTVVVLVLLLFSSLGSYISRQEWLPKRWAMIGLVIMVLLTSGLVGLLSNRILGWPVIFRGAVLGVSLAPLAILMGLPFPFGLAWLERQARQLVPWAWAVNGCASVVAAVLAAILALSYGFTVVLLLGAAAYFVAFLVLKP